MRNRHLLVLVCCLLPIYANAEVMDKLPRVYNMWLHAFLGIVFAGIASRIHWCLFLLAIIYPGFWLFSLLIELYSFDLGPAIFAEAGEAYSVNAHAAAIVWGAGLFALAVREAAMSQSSEKK